MLLLRLARLTARLFPSPRPRGEQAAARTGYRVSGLARSLPASRGSAVPVPAVALARGLLGGRGGAGGRGGVVPRPYWSLRGASPAPIGCRRGRGVSWPAALPRLH